MLFAINSIGAPLTLDQLEQIGRLREMSKNDPVMKKEIHNSLIEDMIATKQSMINSVLFPRVWTSTSDTMCLAAYLYNQKENNIDMVSLMKHDKTIVKLPMTKLIQSDQDMINSIDTLTKEIEQLRKEKGNNMKKNNMIKRIHVAVTPEEQEWINTDAARSGERVSDYIRGKVLASMPPMVILSDGNTMPIDTYMNGKKVEFDETEETEETENK